LAKKSGQIPHSAMALIMMLLVMMDRLVVRNRSEALAISIDIRGSPSPSPSPSPHLTFPGSGCQVYGVLTIIRSHLEAERKAN